MAEVDELDVAVPAEHDVLRLQVPVHQELRVQVLFAKFAIFLEF